MEERLNELHFNENCFGECEEQTTDQEDSEDEFCILEHPDRELEANLSDEVIIKCLVDEKITIVENHFMMPVSIITSGKFLLCFGMIGKIQSQWSKI